MAMKSLSNTYKGKKVLVTGAYGFKGGWLCYSLQQLGADVCAFSLIPEGAHNHFKLLNMDIKSVTADINDIEKLKRFISAEKPEIIFHLAAQSLVRYSYNNPIETFQTNVMGTANVLEVCRSFSFVKAVIAVTSDKCYENKETGKSYIETDAMGGYDPYSSSKGCAELVVASYRNSYFNPEKYGKTHQCLLASARAGNVIGGGDWSLDRLIPDMVQAANQKKQVIIRNPDAVRPWQHVLEPIFGYLLLGEKLLDGQTDFATAFNFGPKGNETMTVKEVLDIANSIWGEIDYSIKKDETLHEAKLLMLDCSKANTVLKWEPVWDTKTAIAQTIYWYMEYYSSNSLSTESHYYKYINSNSSRW
jgi:CDP-glucose 4,6-dehydratase